MEFCFKFELKECDMAQATIKFTIIVNPVVTPPPALVLLDGNGNHVNDGDAVGLQNQTVGVESSQVVLNVSGGVGPYTYVLLDGSSLPSGDSLSAVVNADGSETITLE